MTGSIFKPEYKSRDIAFTKYLLRKGISNNKAVADIFILKCQFMYLKRLQKGATLQGIYDTIGSMSIIDSFDIKKCSTAFDGFLHFIAFYVKDLERINNVIKEWKSEGRGCREINEQGFTVFDIALKMNNPTFVGICIEKYKLDIDKQEFFKLYSIISSDIVKIEDSFVINQLNPFIMSSFRSLSESGDTSRSNAFEEYLFRKKITTSEGVEDLFILKCCFVHLKGINKGSTLQKVYDLVSLTTIIDSFSIINHPKVFNGFLHFVAARIKDSERINNIIKEWKSEGRLCGDSNDEGLTVFDIGFKNSNTNFIEICIRKYGIELEKIEHSGLSLLHRVVHIINEDHTKFPIMDMCLEADFPFDIRAGEEAGGDANKTPIVLAMELAKNEIEKQGNKTGLSNIKNEPKDKSVMFDL